MNKTRDEFIDEVIDYSGSPDGITEVARLLLGSAYDLHREAMDVSFSRGYLQGLRDHANSSTLDGLKRYHEDTVRSEDGIMFEPKKKEKRQ